MIAIVSIYRFEQAIKDGKLGGEGAGLEAVAAGGMHSVVVDEAGRVSSVDFSH